MTAPTAVLIIKVDTLGDLVVFAPTLRALRTAWPKTRLMVLIRHSYLDLAPLLVPGIEWLSTTIDPFSHRPDAAPAELKRLQAAIATLVPDIIGAASSRRNWLEIALAATARAPRCVALGEASQDEFFSTQLRVQLGVDFTTTSIENIPLSSGGPDWENNFCLADTLIGRPVTRTRPRLQLSSEVMGLADGWIKAHGLTRGGYVICAAAGFANVALKTWAPAHFSASLTHLSERHGLPTVLIGHQRERAHLEAITGAKGLWLGEDGDLPQLAGLIAGAALYFGNDTGAMHLAAALNVPVAAVFGGGTWPRFAPAAERGSVLVHPLPCFGCGWDCAFGDAPCLGLITVADALQTLDLALVATNLTIREVDHVSPETRDFMNRAARQYRGTRSGHLARQHKLEALTNLDLEKDDAIQEKEASINEKEASLFEKEQAIGEKQTEIVMLKAVCEEREKTIFILDGHVKYFQAENASLQAAKVVSEKTLAALPADATKAAQSISDQLVHIRNLEALLKQQEVALAEFRTTEANRAAGRHDLEQAKHYGKLLAEKEAVIQALSRGLTERDKLIKELVAETTHTTGDLHKLWLATVAFVRERWQRPLAAWWFRRVVENYWMQIGVLRHYAPRPLRWDRLPRPQLRPAALPQIALVTPSYGQEKFIGRTLRSVIDQAYPKLRYAVQDGGSKDRSAEIIAEHAAGLQHWESAPDRGQADAVQRGFTHLADALAPEDIMAWLNSDDLLAPTALRYVAEYFARHPEVDVIYGHRIIIDEEDRDVGRWLMPRHRPETLEWIDYVPQETMFWRKRAWDLVGGIDASFQFALDWDLLARFHQARCRMVRVPYFLGAFRVHAEQKTSQAIHTTGAEEMRRIRRRFHGERPDEHEMINQQARHARFWGAVTARLHAVGIRW